MYVGGGTHESGESGPTMLEYDSKGSIYEACYFPRKGIEFILTECVYLVNQPGNFEWIPSKNGEIVKGAVEYMGVPVGRVYHKTVVMRIGKIISAVGQKCIYYPYGGFEFKAYIYEALIFKPLL